MTTSMSEFDADTIYRQYAAAYARCNEIALNLAKLEEFRDDVAINIQYVGLCGDGDDAYFNLLQLYHKLEMCMSLDVAAVRAKLRKCGVFDGDVEDGKTKQMELDV